MAFEMEANTIEQLDRHPGVPMRDLSSCLIQFKLSLSLDPPSSYVVALGESVATCLDETTGQERPAPIFIPAARQLDNTQRRDVGDSAW
ncbi:hypothetical protein VE04_06081 [Pseudogymnoascus sp. 24MN13]|nr:hypothetical protein VE04_06081 [Pseudogymnoascus sp. 24MN13]